MQGYDPFGSGPAPDPRRVQARRTMRLGCLGCLLSGGLFALGAGGVVVGLVVNEPIALFVGIPLAALGALGGVVSSAVNQFGFAGDLAARWSGRR